MTTERKLRSSLQRVLDLLKAGASIDAVNDALAVLSHDVAAFKKEQQNEMVATRRERLAKLRRD